MAQQMMAVSGNTYPVKDQIRALGGRWDAARKVWMVPADRAPQAQALAARGITTTRRAPETPRHDRQASAPLGHALVGPTLGRAQGRDRVRVGDVLAAQLQHGEIAECETRQSIAAIDIDGTAPVRAGQRRVAVVVISASSLTATEVEDQDAWHEQHSAVVRLATEIEAAPLVASRRGDTDRRIAQAEIDASLAPMGLGREWQAPTGSTTIASAPPSRPGSLASTPWLIAGTDGAVYHVTPLYDDSPVARLSALTIDQARDLARRAGWGMR